MVATAASKSAKTSVNAARVITAPKNKWVNSYLALLYQSCLPVATEYNVHKHFSA
jgi:hypothetical protein